MSLHKSKGNHDNLVLNKLIHQNGHADCERPPVARETWHAIEK